MRKVSKSLFLGTLAVLALAGIVVSGCADRKGAEEPQTHVEGWIDPGTPQFHGAKISAENLIACAQCHGSDYRGGTSGVSCYKCHAEGPSGHPAGWLDVTAASFHGKRVAAQSDTSCAVCHGADFKGKDNNGISCYTCHNGPSGHPKTGWLLVASPNFHGLAASSQGLTYCAQCHGADFKGDWSGTACNECHADQSGHPSSGWLDPSSANFHGARMIATSLAYCAGCHGADYKGGQAGVSCYQCHNGPSGHPADSEWLNESSPQFHGLEVAAKGPSACAVCHGADYKGGIAGVSCYQCHNGPSGHPADSDWLNPSSAQFHGVALSTRGLAACAACHGSDYNGGTSGQSCYECHDGPSGHPAAAVWLDKTNAQFHGLAASSRGLPACAVCHGSDFKGGISGQSCFQCHDGPSGHPAIADWLNSASPKFHGIRLSQTGTQYCAGCHGADFKGGYAKVSCYTCHNGPSGHPTGWLNPSAGTNFHGNVVETSGTADCLKCHGSDLSGGISGVACSDCH